MRSSVHVDAPVKRAWNLIADASHWPDWSEVCTEVWDVQGQLHWRVGDTFGFRLKMANRNVPFNVTISRFETGTIIQWKSTKFSITAVRSIVVTEEDKGCRITDSKHFTSSVLPIRVAYPKRLIRRMTESWLMELKRESESIS
jgi:hypothetical protein